MLAGLLNWWQNCKWVVLCFRIYKVSFMEHELHIYSEKIQMFKKDTQAEMRSDRQWKCHGDLEAPSHPSRHSWKHSI